MHELICVSGCEYHLFTSVWDLRASGAILYFWLFLTCQSPATSALTLFYSEAPKLQNKVSMTGTISLWRFDFLSAAAVAVRQTPPDIFRSHDHIHSSVPLNTTRSVLNIWGFSHCVYVSSRCTVSASIIIRMWSGT